MRLLFVQISFLNDFKILVRFLFPQISFFNDFKILVRFLFVQIFVFNDFKILVRFLFAQSSFNDYIETFCTRAVNFVSGGETVYMTVV